MAVVPLAVIGAGVPAGVAAAYTYRNGGTPVSLDVDDLAVTVTLTGTHGTIAGTWTISDDDLTLVAWPPVDAPAGEYVTVTSITSATLAATAVAASTVYRRTIDHGYGATLAGVEAFVSDLTITYSSNPSAGDVDGWLDDIAARVAGRIGDLPDPIPAGKVVALELRARGLVQLGAAAFAEDAAHPDRMLKQGDQRYGAVLWARYMTGLDELAVDTEAAREAAGLNPDTSGPRHAAASFPAAHATYGRGI